MSAVNFVRADEQQEVEAGAFAVDASPLVGRWINTNTSTPGMSRVIVGKLGDDLTIRISSANGPTPREWGDAPVDVVYANGVGSQTAMALVACYDFGHLETRVEANLSLGLLVVATFNTFKDGSHRSNYFGREFFYRAEESGEEHAA